MGRAERGYKLGKWVRRFRERQGLTQREVAQAAGVTAAFLSQMENDKAEASQSTLHAILAAMNVTSLGEFFFWIERSQNRIHTVEDRVMMIGPDEPIRMEYMGPRSRGFSFCVMCVEVDPGYESPDVDKDPFDQCIIVTEGKLGIVLDGEDFEIIAGETCFIEAFCSHTARNLSDGVTKFFAVNSSQTRDDMGRAIHPFTPPQ